MISEIRKNRNRKFFKKVKWTLSELKKLEKFLKSLPNLSYKHIGRIQNFKKYQLNSWCGRNRRLDKQQFVTNAYTCFLKFGKDEGFNRYHNMIEKIRYASTKEGMIERFGEEKAKEISYRMGAAFRDSNIQRSNALKFAEKRKNNDRYKNILPTQIGYWLKKGYSEKEATQKLKERQTTFSLDICTEKYGEEEGLKRFKERQDKWQNTLKSKPQSEIDKMNSLKNPIIVKENESRDDYHTRLEKIGKMCIYDDIELKDFITNSLKNPKWLYLCKNEFIKSLPYCGNSKYYPDEILNDINFNFPSENLVHKVGIFYSLKTPEGYLRSMLEINFYFELKKRKINFEVEKFYNITTNKKYKSDFFIKDENLHIEIAGTEGNLLYDEKMEFKERTFDAIIIKPKQIKLFFERIDTHGFKKIRDYLRGTI